MNGLMSKVQSPKSVKTEPGRRAGTARPTYKCRHGGVCTRARRSIEMRRVLADCHQTAATSGGSKGGIFSGYFRLFRL
jgi:hypothetical protein